MKRKNNKNDKDKNGNNEREEEEDEIEVEEDAEEEEKEKAKPPTKKRVTVNGEHEKIEKDLHQKIEELTKDLNDVNADDENIIRGDGSTKVIQERREDLLKSYIKTQRVTKILEIGSGSVSNFRKSISSQSKDEQGGSIIRINVGGQVFTTTKPTLLKIPGTLLYEIATNTGNARFLPRDPKGNFFVDRSPLMFEHILDYLRNGELYIPNTSEERRLMVSEAEYYRITPIIRKLKGAPMDSALGLNDDFTRTLTEWCNADSFKLIYRASRDGNTAASFHEKCDGHGPTLFLVKSELGYLLGGYTKVKWDSKTDNRLLEGSHKEFIFSLRNPSKTEPLIFPVRKHSNFKCLLHNIRYGPSLGSNSAGLCEIHIADKPDENTNSHTLGFPSMFDGKGYTNKIFTGTDRFKVSDYEVFEITERDGQEEQQQQQPDPVVVQTANQ